MINCKCYNMVLKFTFLLIISYLFIGSNAQVIRLNELSSELKLFILSADQNIPRRFNINHHPDVGLSVPELITKNDYPTETHFVETSDNYILTLHRIPHGIKNKNETNKKVFFLMHGIMASSADWVLLGPEKSLAYLLADRGYDVWMGNARGNKYSRNHTSLDPDEEKELFWDFSWHEIGIYDVPQMIDFILKTTEKEKLFYVGHSQGCTTFFVMTSLLPEYNDKIEMMFALAPAVFMANAESPLLRFSTFLIHVAKVLLKLFGANEFLPDSKFINDVAGILCDQSAITQGICSNTLFLLAGFDEEQLDKERLPVMLSNTPAGCSTGQVLHFVQNAANPKNLFSQFDHGINKNALLYSSPTPPEYPLDKVTARIALFSSDNDLFVAIKDVVKLHSVLTNANVVSHFRNPFKKLTHLDFQWAKDVVPLVYNEIFKQLEQI